MAKISIEPSKAKSILGQQDSLEKTLKALSQDVDSVRGGLRYKIAGQEQISQRLREAAEQITKESQSTLAMRSGLEEIIALYEQSETGNLDRVAVEKASIQQGKAPEMGEEDGGAHEASWWEKLIDLLLPKTGDTGEGEGKLDYPIPLIIGGLIFPLQYYDWSKEKTGLSGEWEMSDALKDKGIFKKLDDFVEGHKETLADKKAYWDPEKKEWKAIDPKDKEALEEFEKRGSSIPVETKLWGIGTSGSLYALGADGEFQGEHSGGEWSAKLGELAGDASAYIGTMGIGATIGAGITIFSAEGEAFWGSEDTQLYAKGGVDIGRAEAEASFGAGLVNEDGKFDPDLHANFSAEAIAGEISGSVGGKALGTDVALEGSLNFGVGAHADFGFQDGKLSLDVGASLGVGASIKLDIDVSGTVNAIGQGIGDVVSGTGEFIGNAVEGAGEFFGALFGGS